MTRHRKCYCNACRLRELLMQILAASDEELADFLKQVEESDARKASRGER